MKYTLPVGTTFTPLQLTGYYQQVPGSSVRITAEVLSQVAQVGPVQRQLRQLSILAFPGFDFVVYNKDEKSAELADIISKQDEHVNTLQLARHSFFDRCVYGCALFEKTWMEDKGWIVPNIVQWLPARSFAYKPDSLVNVSTERYIFGKVLNGIVFDTKEKKYLFYQRTSSLSDFVQIPQDQLLFNRDPNTEYPDGESHLSGIVPTIQQWQFVRKNLMQFMHRVGKPNAVAKILPEANTGMRLPSQIGLSAGAAIAPGSAFTGVWNYLDQVVQSQGAENAFVLPPYTDLVYPNISTAINPLEPDQYLIREIIAHLFPRDYLESIGKSIQSTSQPLLLLLNMMISGHRELSSRIFEDYWTEFLRLNGYEDFKVQLKWWNLLPKDESSELNRAISATQSDLMLIDEGREQLGLPALTDEMRSRLYEEMIAKKTKGFMPDTKPKGEPGRKSAEDKEDMQQDMSIWYDVTTPLTLDEALRKELRSVPNIAAKVLSDYGIIT